MEHRFDNGILTVNLTGRLDSLSAPAAQNEVNALLDETGAKAIVIDLDGLKYVASAGLRVFLQLKKRVPEFSVINVPAEIYEVFEMTGFTEIMKVVKAYRRVPIEVCEVIGRGANGTIYRMTPEIIVKTCSGETALADIARERELARRAFVLGVPTAISFDIVRIGDGYGAAYELLDAKTVAQILRADRNQMDHCAELMTGLVKIIHTTSAKAGEMPSARGALLGYAEYIAGSLDGETARKLVSLVAALPDALTMIHGDYHIKNVMVQNDEAILIDMDTLSCGHPVIELGYMYNAYCGFTELNEEEGTEFIGLSAGDARAFWRKQLQLYLGTNDEARLTEIENKARIVGYIKLLRYVIRRIGIDTEEGRKQAEYLKNELKTLVNQTESLAW